MDYLHRLHAHNCWKHNFHVAEWISLNFHAIHFNMVNLYWLSHSKCYFNEHFVNRHVSLLFQKSNRKKHCSTRSSSIAGLFLRFNLVRWLFAFVCAFLRSFEWAASRNYFVLARNCVLCALICRRYVHWLLFCEAKRKNFYQRTPKKGLLRSSNKRYNVRRNNWNEGRR